MPTITEIEARVRFIIASTLGLKDSKIFLQSRLAEDLGADSLDISQIVLDIEKEFDITVLDNASERLRTVSDIVNFIVLANEVKV